MSYYILPKKHIFFSLTPYEAIADDISDAPFISHSVYYYMNEIDNELSHCNITNSTIELLQKQFNPYEYLRNKDFIHSNKYSFTYFIFIELLKISNIMFDTYAIDKYKGINIFCDSEINDIMSSIIYINKYNKLHFSQTITENIDIMTFLQTNIVEIKSYTIDLLTILSNILLFQSNHGSTIIKIGEIMYKPIIDILYILSLLYNKVYIIKPYSSSGFSNERYIICKKFTATLTERKTLHLYFSDVLTKWTNCEKVEYRKNSSLFSNEIPYHFINKIEESNLGIAHQLLEYNDILINAIYNNLCKEKLESIKKNSINKCIIWCDKYKIPYNKTSDKNIFLQKIEPIVAEMELVDLSFN